MACAVAENGGCIIFYHEFKSTHVERHCTLKKVVTIEGSDQ